LFNILYDVIADVIDKHEPRYEMKVSKFLLEDDDKKTFLCVLHILKQ